MRTARFADGWEAYAEPPELGIDQPRRLGFISGRGGLTLSSGWGRGQRRTSAMYALEDARRSLVRSGELVDPALERARREEQKTGSFVVELDDGRVGRFHEYRAHSQQDRGTPLFRPGAEDWANEELDAGHATHADLFRAPVGNYPRRARLYLPRVLPSTEDAFGAHPPLVIGHAEQLPIYSWSQRPVERRGRGAQGNRPSRVDLAYRLKEDAMKLVDRRALGEPVPPDVIAEAWEVATDAFIEAQLPLQIEVATANADHWRDRELVSTRRKPRSSRRRQGTALRRRR